MLGLLHGVLTVETKAEFLQGLLGGEEGLRGIGVGFGFGIGFADSVEARIEH